MYYSDLKITSTPAMEDVLNDVYKPGKRCVKSELKLAKASLKSKNYDEAIKHTDLAIKIIDALEPKIRASKASVIRDLLYRYFVAAITGALTGVQIIDISAGSVRKSNALQYLRNWRAKALKIKKEAQTAKKAAKGK